MKEVFLEILRPSIILLTIFAVIAGAIISGANNILNVIIAAAVAGLIAGSGNALNDYFDYEIDRINKPSKPIPSGKIAGKSVLIYSLALIFISIALATLLNFYCLILAVFNVFFIFIYNIYLKRTAIGHFAESWLGVSAFLFGALLSTAITIPVLILCMLAYFSNTGREIAKGIEDIEGDRKFGAKTLPVAIGIGKSRIISIIFVLAAVALTPFPYLYKFVNIYYVFIAAPCALVFLASLYFLFKDISKSQKLMKIAMFIGIFAVLAGINI